MKSLTALNCYRLDTVRIKLFNDDCPECQGIGEIEGEAVKDNRLCSVELECPACKGSGKIEKDQLERDDE